MEKTTETTITETTTTPPSPANATTPTIALESTTTADSEISTRSSGNAKADPTTKLTTSGAARGIQGLPCVELILVVLLAPMIFYEK